MGLELEFKYALTGPGQLEELRQELEKAFGPWEAVEMETVYYDTPDQALAARHWTLRVRQENGRPVLTVKTPGPGRARGEWELPGGDWQTCPNCRRWARHGKSRLCSRTNYCPGAAHGSGGSGSWPACRMPWQSWPWTRECSPAADVTCPFGSWRQSEKGAAARPWPSGAGVCLKPGISRKRPGANSPAPPL